MSGRRQCKYVIGATGDVRNLGLLGKSGSWSWIRCTRLDAVEAGRSLVRLRNE